MKSHRKPQPSHGPRPTYVDGVKIDYERPRRVYRPSPLRFTPGEQIVTSLTRQPQVTDWWDDQRRAEAGMRVAGLTQPTMTKREVAK